nr:hypothetical protein B0A51_06553 [Rachicladosporium sp. CCFEE 5018]
MPERPLTVAAYAAGASLAAATLVYVFGPTYFFDDEAANSSRSGRKKGVVGLSNPANDCFINSVLQSLAGLPELRLYLIREMHWRQLDGAALYEDLTAALEEGKKKDGVQVPEWKLLGLQRGLITAGLKDVLDALNERPIYKKTISAQSFVRVVEEAFRTRVSRYQQDAQEFLQIVTERLADEHSAGRRVRMRKKARRRNEGLEAGQVQASVENQSTAGTLEASEETIKAPKLQISVNGPRDSAHDSPTEANSTIESESDRVDSGADIPEKDLDTEPVVFPLEGKLESQVECTHCHFKPKPSVSSFVTLTLNVPNEKTSTSLNDCFDGMLKVEHIDDYSCDRCRLEYALQLNARQLNRQPSASERTRLEEERRVLEHTIATDPESPPKDLKLPDSTTTPKRRITRHTRIASFPRVLAIHLSRSVWDRQMNSSKNISKVAFPETLPLGGLLDRKTYRLMSVVTHKGGHNSGHYETFRRQWLSPPYSTPTNMGKGGIYSIQGSPAASPRISAAPSPRLSANATSPTSLEQTSTNITSTTSSHSLHRLSLDPSRRGPPPSIPLDAIPTPGLPEPPAEREAARPVSRRESVAAKALGLGRKRKVQQRWWRISDDKIKESKTSDVLGMQREVYLLFYEQVEEGAE